MKTKLNNNLKKQAISKIISSLNEDGINTSAFRSKDISFLYFSFEQFVNYNAKQPRENNILFSVRGLKDDDEQSSSPSVSYSLFNYAITIALESGSDYLSTIESFSEKYYKSNRKFDISLLMPYTQKTFTPSFYKILRKKVKIDFSLYHIDDDFQIWNMPNPPIINKIG